MATTLWGEDMFAVNLGNREELRRVVAEVRPDAVAHLAAISFVAHGDAEAIYRTNVVGTRNLLEALAGLEQRPRAVLLASSANIYGNAPVEVIDESVRTGACQRLRGEQAGDGVHGPFVDGSPADRDHQAIQLHRRRSGAAVSAAQDRRAFSAR